MEKSFNSVEFLKDLARELVENFARASRATTPGLVGSAREAAVRQKLESVLPTAAGIGSGCVIDVNGHTSRQQDIVVYDKHVSPVFSINNNPESTYYPCESVIAVGEVKSGLGRSELLDALEKIRSAKMLRRQCTNPMSWRKYGSTLVFGGAPSESFDQDNKVTDQLYGFILCDHFDLKGPALIDEYKRHCSTTAPSLCPSVIISLHDGCILHASAKEGAYQFAHLPSDLIVHGARDHGDFQLLLSRLHWIVTVGRSTERLPFDAYVFGHEGKTRILYQSERERHE